jgi:hypothetical protein
MQPERGSETARPSDGKRARRRQDQLDEALEETFPSSDPVSVSVPKKEQEWTAEELAEAERKKRQQPADR